MRIGGIYVKSQHSIASQDSYCSDLIDMKTSFWLLASSRLFFQGFSNLENLPRQTPEEKIIWHFLSLISIKYVSFIYLPVCLSILYSVGPGRVSNWEILLAVLYRYISKNQAYTINTNLPCVLQINFLVSCKLKQSRRVQNEEAIIWMFRNRLRNEIALFPTVVLWVKLQWLC